MSRFWCRRALLGERVATGVRLEVTDGVIATVTEGAPAGGHILDGLVLPGFANAHSHAFHRALRGRTARGRGDFWTWRAQMYAVAGRLDPDSYRALATAVYAEMALAGITGVAEFHYLHHGPGGVPYADPNAMQEALADAAAAAGIRLTLLDTCYLTGGIGRELEGPQRRFGDGDAERWAVRAAARRPRPHVRLGAAVHSVRAVPADQLAVVAATAGPLHAHVSEQPAENEACRAAYGRTPTQLLAEHGLLGPRFTAVHATHLTDDDVARLGTARAGVCFCPTTERDLADGIGPARRLVEAGCPLSLGSDSHAVIDPFEELRGLEMHERLASGRRGHFTPEQLLSAAGHHAALGGDGGRIAVGAPADLVAVHLDSVRTVGGSDPVAAVTSAATAADVTDVVVAGRFVVRDREHQTVPDVGRALSTAIGALHA